jgi:hypothetical protein
LCALSVIQLPTGGLQLFYGGQTMWQTEAGTNPGAFNVLEPFGGPGFSVLGACADLNSLPVVWGTAGGLLQVTQKDSINAGAPWTAASAFASQFALAPGAACLDFAAGRSVPGRIQLFAVCGVDNDDVNVPSGALQTCWQDDANEPGYNAFEAMLPTPGPGNPLISIDAQNVSDGRLQLWALATTPGGYQQLWTQWKLGRERNTGWSGWTPATTQPSTAFGAGNFASSVVGGLRQDGQSQIWCTVGTGTPDLVTSIQPAASTPSTVIANWDLWTPPDDGYEWVAILELASGKPSNGSLQLFAVVLTFDAQGNGGTGSQPTCIYTCWEDGGTATGYTAWTQVADLGT